MCSWDSFDRKWVDWCPSQTSQFKFCLIYPNCPSNSIGITLAQSTNPLSAEDGPDPLPLYGLVKRSDGWSAKNGLVNQAQYNRKLLIYSRCLEYPKLIFSDYPLWKTSDLFFPPRLKQCPESHEIHDLAERMDLPFHHQIISPTRPVGPSNTNIPIGSTTLCLNPWAKNFSASSDGLLALHFSWAAQASRIRKKFPSE